MLFICKIIFVREFSIWQKSKSDWLVPILFFLLIVSIFPLAISYELNLLQKIGPGVIWIAVLLASLLALDSIFKQDYELGMFEQFCLSGSSLNLIIFFKVCFHWLFNLIPIIGIMPFVSLFYGLSLQEIFILISTLALGTPCLYFVGAFAAALTSSIPRSGILIFVIILPIYVPLLIFATTALLHSSQGFSILGHLAILGAMSLGAMAFTPFAISAAIKLGCK